jgi:hypothetical protein
MEALVLEQDPAGDVPRPDRSDDGMAPVLDRDRDRRVQQLAAELLPAVAGRDHRAEEVGVGEALRHLDAAEPDDLAVLLVDEQRLFRRLVPVRELALEIVPRRPERISDLLLGAREGAPRQLENGRAVVPREATQAVGHGGRLARFGRSRGPRAR